MSLETPMDKGLNEVRTKNIFFKYFLDKGFFGFERAVALPGGRRNKREKKLWNEKEKVNRVTDEKKRSFMRVKFCISL